MSRLRPLELLCAGVSSLILVGGAPRPALAAPPGGSAETAPPPSPASIAQARTHFARGVKLYEEDDFRAALIEFNRAYDLAPNWAVLYNVGQSYYQLRDYANGYRTLTRYLAEGGAKVPADRRAQVEREVAELRERSAEVTIASNTSGASVTVDDLPLGVTPFTSTQLVGVGRHVFRATSAGRAPVTQVVDIAGGDSVHVTLDFAPSTAVAAAPPPVVPVAAPPPPPAPPPARPPPSYLPAIVTASVGGAALVVGGVFGGLAIGNKSSLKTECTGNACPASAESDINAFSRNGAVSTTGFIVGGVGVAAAVVLYLLERPHKEAPAASGFEIRTLLDASATGFGGQF